MRCREVGAVRRKDVLKVGQADIEALKEKLENADEAEKKAKRKKRKNKLKKESSEFKNGFIKFITKGNVVDLAVAMVIGQAFNKIVNGLVNYIITPCISKATKGINMSDWKFVIQEATDDSAEIAIQYGSLIQAVMDFFIVAIGLFTAITIINKVRATLNRKKTEKAKLAEEKKKAEEKLAAEKKAAEDAVKAEAQRIADAERAETERRFYENVQLQRELLSEIRDMMKKAN